MSDLEGLLATARAAPRGDHRRPAVRSTAASPTATTGCASASATASCGCPGKDTALLGISRRPRRMANETAAALGIAPAVVAARRGLPGHRVRRRRAGRPDALRRSTSRRVARALRAFHDVGTRSFRSASGSPTCSTSTREIVRARGGSPARRVRGGAGAGRPASPTALPLTTPSPATTTCCPATCCATERAVDAARRLGVRGDGPPPVRPRQPRRQQRVRRARPSARLLDAPTSARRRRASRRAALG